VSGSDGALGRAEGVEVLGVERVSVGLDGVDEGAEAVGQVPDGAGGRSGAGQELIDGRAVEVTLLEGAARPGEVGVGLVGVVGRPGGERGVQTDAVGVEGDGDASVEGIVGVGGLGEDDAAGAVVRQGSSPAVAG
jgi:hypothetical protein